MSMPNEGRETRPTVVIGAGAAGAMAAIFASAPGAPRPVLLLERTRDGGRKIVMSGGGRCNVLPSALDPARYVTASSPNILKKLLLSWPLGAQRRYFEEDLGIALALETETGKLFPVSNRSRDVRDTLLAAVRRAGAEIRFDTRVVGIDPDEGTPVSGSPPWIVRLAGGGTVRAAHVIVATGGLSVPATGSDGAGFEWMRALGHTIHPTYPALTPLTGAPPRHAALAGVSLNVTLEAPGSKRPFVTAGGFLFTHKGYSGPAVLNLSHLAVRSRLSGGPRQEIYARWTALDAAAWDETLRAESAAVLGLLRRHLPVRLAEMLLGQADVPPETPTSQLRRQARVRLVELLTRYRLPWTGDEGYTKAEVTGGGVALGEIDPRTMESRLHPGLFLCGEILDAFGPIGGYNFAWAWATGRAAGLGSRAASW
jgi:predicted Rossmann fold flavoprotein